jgi:hypothetical protein
VTRHRPASPGAPHCTVCRAARHAKKAPARGAPGCRRDSGDRAARDQARGSHRETKSAELGAGSIAPALLAFLDRELKRKRSFHLHKRSRSTSRSCSRPRQASARPPVPRFAFGSGCAAGTERSQGTTLGTSGRHVRSFMLCWRTCRRDRLVISGANYLRTSKSCSSTHRSQPIAVQGLHAGSLLIEPMRRQAGCSSAVPRTRRAAAAERRRHSATAGVIAMRSEVQPAQCCCPLRSVEPVLGPTYPPDTHGLFLHARLPPPRCPARSTCRALHVPCPLLFESLAASRYWRSRAEPALSRARLDSK